MAKQTSAKKPPANQAPKKSAAAQKKSKYAVRIRMYCQGLGDCFLLTFPGSQKGSEFHVLIDCGVILGTENGNDRLQEVVENIYATTQGKLNLLVGTHEHWDHISGFAHPDQIFDKFDIKQTWLAWTEDPNNDTANKIRQDREDKKKKLGLAIDHYQKSILANEEGGPTELHARLAGLSSFFGIDMQAAQSEADIGKTAQAMKYLRSKNPTYLKPSTEPIKVSGLNDVEIFVLGPPSNPKLLKKSLPTKKGHEVFEDDTPASTLKALFKVDVPDDTFDKDSQPFAEHHSQSLVGAWADPFFAQFYDNGLPNHPAAWKRIDDIGMFAATELALQLDAATNNTSLVLAFRLPNGRVLLFPGDAQVGNWESWHQSPLDAQKTAELLANTLVYKLAHHGSENATLRALGLNMMTSPDLIALLPVDEDVAHNKKHWTKMPFVPLLTELRNKTQGRILRADHEVKHSVTDPDAALQPSWTASAEKFTSEPKRSLYLELFV